MPRPRRGSWNGDASAGASRKSRRSSKTVQGLQPSHLHFGAGWLIEARMADPAAYAQAQIDEWQKRIKADGSARPSPSIEVAQRTGYEGDRRSEIILHRQSAEMGIELY